MRNLLLGIILGSALTTGLVFAGDYLGAGGHGNYLGQSETQQILQDIRTREFLETVQMNRQNYLDQQVQDAGKLPCR